MRSEALFTSWERLKKWIEGGEQVIFAKNRLADDSRRWRGYNSQIEELLIGSRLVETLEMRARSDFDIICGGLFAAETQFVDASVARRDRTHQEFLESVRKLREARRKIADRHDGTFWPTEDDFPSNRLPPAPP
jgi:hypothetical protein